MSEDKKGPGLWRLRLNWFIVLFLGQVLFKVSATAYLTSFHRFVTNPRSEHLDETHSDAEPGLADTEFFYSLILASFYISACAGTLIAGFLVLCVPYWYLYIAAICSQIIGYTIYGVASHGWHLLVSQALVGYFIGAQVTLSFSYANDSSATYAELIRERDNLDKVDAVHRTRIRDLLYTLITVGNVLGYYVGPGVAVLFSHVLVDQFHSIAWLNVAYGLLLLVVAVFLFRGEIRCKKSSSCGRCDIKATKPGALQIFILLSMFLLSLIDMFKMGFYETLLNPLLSDSFGLSLSVGSYFYLALGVPRLLGSILLFALQKFKFSSNLLLLIGIVMTMVSYVFLTDWQTIPYDPCTEYSPFHHPEIVDDLTPTFNSTLMSHSMSYGPRSPESRTFNSHKVQFKSRIVFNFGNSSTLSALLPAVFGQNCALDPHCPCDQTSDTNSRTPCYVANAEEDINNTSLVTSLLYTCSFGASLACLKVYVSDDRNESDTVQRAQKQEVLVLSNETYNRVSNSCMSADVPGRQCHWIPFSTITHTKCDDCPPICRARSQTLNFVQFMIGMALIVLVFPIISVPLMSIVTDNAPSINGSKGIVLGVALMTSFLAQAFSPLVLDAAYEGVQKRTFLITILLATAHIPFLVEIVVLYKRMGGSKSSDKKAENSDQQEDSDKLGEDLEYQGNSDELDEKSKLLNHDD